MLYDFINQIMLLIIKRSPRFDMDMVKTIVQEVFILDEAIAIDNQNSTFHSSQPMRNSMFCKGFNWLAFAKRFFLGEGKPNS